MSSEQTFSTSDLRSTAQDYKRDAARKSKWALGSAATFGRAEEDHPRPQRPHETNFNFKRRAVKGAVAALHHGTKVARRHDMLEGIAMSDESSNSSASDYDETPSPPADASVVYSFDAARSPSHGSQILNAALAQAVKKYEDRETVKLIKDEYEVLDDEGESIGVTPAKKGKKAKVHAEPAVVLMDADDGDWECI